MVHALKYNDCRVNVSRLNPPVIVFLRKKMHTKGGEEDSKRKRVRERERERERDHERDTYRDVMQKVRKELTYTELPVVYRYDIKSIRPLTCYQLLSLDRRGRRPAPRWDPRQRNQARLCPGATAFIAIRLLHPPLHDMTTSKHRGRGRGASSD